MAADEHHREPAKWSECLRCGRELQLRAALLHVVALGNTHERQVRQLVKRVIERVPLLIKEPLLPELLVQPC
eukprot:15272-Prymnesium_polylepis.1